MVVLALVLAGCGGLGKPPTPNYNVAQQFLDFRSRTASGQPVLADVSGDGVPDALYVSYPKGDCGRCRAGYVTVLVGERILFDGDQSYGSPSIEGLPSGTGFLVRESVWQPGDSGVNPTGKRIWTYQFRAAESDFTLIRKEEPPITDRWQSLPIPPSVLKNGRESSMTYPVGPGIPKARQCTTLAISLDVATPDRLSVWINDYWPRDGLVYGGTDRTVQFWSRPDRTSDYRVYLPNTSTGSNVGPSILVCSDTP
jgi:hypothetical protein